jgi:hypothetical protein
VRTDPAGEEDILIRDIALEALQETTGITLAQQSSNDEKVKAWLHWWQNQHDQDGAANSLHQGKSAPADEEKDFYRFTGRVVNLRIKEDSTNIFIVADIEYKLTNIGLDNLILWRRQRPDFDEGPAFTGKVVSKSYFFSTEDVLESHYGGPSNDYSEKWSFLRSSLDKERPPAAVTMTLRPGESWDFSSPVTIIADKEESKFTKEISFETLRRVSPIWIKASYEVWSFNIEPIGEERSINLKFGRMLQKRWGKYGHLMLQDITSEPILVDISQVNSYVGKATRPR